MEHALGLENKRTWIGTKMGLHNSLAVLYCKQRAQPMIREEAFSMIWQKVELQGMNGTMIYSNVHVVLLVFRN
jgi:hypothetical protein